MNTNIESLKAALLFEFKERGKGKGEAIPMSEWYDTILHNYTEAEQEMFLKAVSALQKEEKIDVQLGGINPGISLK